MLVCSTIISVMLSQEGDSPIQWCFGWPAALGFAFGSAWAFFRMGLEIDKLSQSITCWWGWIVKLGSVEHPLCDYKTVRISKRTPESQPSSKQTVYLVELIGDGPNIVVDTVWTYFHARDIAVDLANFLDFGIDDQCLTFGNASRP